VLLSIAGGSDLGLFEINEAAGLVAGAVHQDANIIFGAVIDDALGDEVRVTVIAAGFDGGEPKVRDASQPALLKDAPVTPPTAEQIAADPLLDGEADRVTVPADPPPTEYGDDLDVPDFLR
jgi:cell division protein FtsZ